MLLHFLYVYKKLLQNEEGVKYCHVVVVVDPKLLSSSLLYSQFQADKSACLLQLV